MSVTLKNISKVFRDQDQDRKEFTAVKHVNLEIQDGEMVTFLGPSGCGKTTTLRMISGFESPTTGEIWISGKMVNDIPPNKRDTSMVFQSYAIFPHLSVAQNIGFGLELKGFRNGEIRKQVEEIMQVMNLGSLENRRPDQLSGGQQQRVALARAIINRPKVLLFDEPLSNLDAKLRDQMRLEIRRIQQNFGITSIYVTHDQDEAMTVSDRIMVMKEGEVMQIGTPFEIYSRPQNRFVADFIGRVNFFRGRISAGNEGCIVLDYYGCTKEFHLSPESFLPDTEVDIVVRPESLKLLNNASEGQCLKGKVKRLVYLGATVEYEIETQYIDQPILAVSYNPVENGVRKVGENVFIDFSPEAAHLLPL